MVRAAVASEKLIIDKEFAGLIPACSGDEVKQLEANLLAVGCLDALVVWDCGVKLVLLDGHNRYRICNKHGLAHRIKKLEFESRGEAKNWVINHQLGRRNITDEQRRYLLGKLYADKKPEKGAHPSSDTVSYEGTVPASDIAVDHGVSERTVRRAADFSETVDAIGAKSPELKKAILAGDVKASTSDLEALAEAPKRKVESVAKKVAAGDKKAVKDAVEREPGDDTESEASAEKAHQASRRNNGREEVSPKARKAAMKAFGVVVRFVETTLGRTDCKRELDHILAAIQGK